LWCNTFHDSCVVMFSWCNSLFSFSYARTDSELLKDIIEDVLEKLPPRCRNQCKGWVRIEEHHKKIDEISCSFIYSEADECFVALQVENLTRKAQLQAIANEESAKCKAAEKVIKSLTSQVETIFLQELQALTYRDRGLVTFIFVFSFKIT